MANVPLWTRASHITLDDELIRQTRERGRIVRALAAVHTAALQLTGVALIGHARESWRTRVRLVELTRERAIRLRIGERNLAHGATCNIRRRCRGAI